ncbi:MAG: MFS transporter [Solirubrobacterales bacterium]
MEQRGFKGLVKTLFPKPASRKIGEMAVASGVSTIGGTMCTLTFAYLAFSETQSAFAAVLVGVAYTVSFALVARPGAALLRKLDRRRAWAICVVIKIVGYAIGTALAFMGDLSLPILLANSALGGLTSGPQYPAWQQLLRRLSPKGQLDETDGLFSSTSAVGAAIGAVAGGILLDAFGAGVPLLLNVLSYVPLFFVVISLPASVGKVEATTVQKKGPSARLVLEKMWENRITRFAVLFTVLLQFLVWPIVGLLPKVASEFGSSAHIYGILLGSVYFGGILVAGLLLLAKERLTYRIVIWLALITVATALVLLAVVGFLPIPTDPSVALASLILLLIGAVLGVTGSILSAVTQLSADRELEGQVLALYASVSLSVGAVGGMIQGLLADSLEIWWLPLATGGLVLIALVYLTRRHDFRVFDKADPDHNVLRRHLWSRGAPEDSPLTQTTSGGASRPLSTGTATSRT